MDRSYCFSHAINTPVEDSYRRIVEFDSLAHDYGSFFAGFPWQVWACGTFRSPHTSQHADASFIAFEKELEKQLRSPVAYIAVAERRYSGVGLSAIRLHWHFVLATADSKRDDLLSYTKSLWSKQYGNPSVEPYDSQRSGAHYMAKTAAKDDFHYLQGNLDRLHFAGPQDLYEASLVDLYVPDNVRGRSTGTTLVIRSHAGEWREK